MGRQRGGERVCVSWRGGRVGKTSTGESFVLESHNCRACVLRVLPQATPAAPCECDTPPARPLTLSYEVLYSLLCLCYRIHVYTPEHGDRWDAQAFGSGQHTARDLTTAQHSTATRRDRDGQGRSGQGQQSAEIGPARGRTGTAQGRTGQGRDRDRTGLRHCLCFLQQQCCCGLLVILVSSAVLEADRLSC